MFTYGYLLHSAYCCLQRGSHALRGINKIALLKLFDYRLQMYMVSNLGALSFIKIVVVEFQYQLFWCLLKYESAYICIPPKSLKDVSLKMELSLTDRPLCILGWLLLCHISTLFPIYILFFKSVVVKVKY